MFVSSAEGSRGKAEAEQQAARAALEALCGVLDKATVFRNNHKGALQDLLVRFKQPLPGYGVTESPGGDGDRVTWLPGEDPAGGGGPAEGRKEDEGGAEEGPYAEIVPPLKRMILDRSDRPSKMSKVQPSTAGSQRPGKQGGCFGGKFPTTGLIHLVAILVSKH